MLDWHTLAFYEIADKSELHLVLRLRGMITTLNSRDQSDPLVKYLMLSDEERAQDELPLKALQEAAQQASRWHTLNFSTDANVISPQYRMLLSSFLDYMWDNTAPGPRRVDLRLAVPQNQFLRLLGGDKTANMTRHMLDVRFTQIPGSHPPTKIALRMTKGPSKACIQLFDWNGASCAQ